MEILLKRVFRHVKYTLGKVYIDGTYFCDCIEDTDRNLNDSMTLEQIRARKKYGTTAIPKGKYLVDMDTVSTRFSKKKFYREVCDGKLPRLKKVKGFSGVLIHCGNSAEDTNGCIILGKNDVQGKVLRSQSTFRKFYSILKEAHNSGEEIWLTIR